MPFATCKLSVIPVRKEAKDSSEQTTQLLFGETVEILEEINNWCKIKTLYEEYQGWIDKRQVETTSQTPQKQHPDQKETFCGENFGTLSNQTYKLFIPFGSILQLDKHKIAQWSAEKWKYQGKILQTRAFNEENTIQLAKKFINVPYLWGGKSIFGIDCSGFTQTIYRLMGIKLLRDSYQQAQQGTTIDQTKDAKTGDLAFFQNNNGKIIHVGILLSPTEIIHASSKVRIDPFDPKGIFNTDTKTYSHELKTIKRMV